MASGRKGAVKPAADTDTVLATNAAGSGLLVTVNVSVCNQGSSTATVRVALVDGTTTGDLAATDYVEYGLEIGPNEAFERSALVLGEGQSVIVRADTADVSFVAYGIEQTTS